MTTTHKLSDGRICVVRTENDTADSLIAAMVEHADQRKGSSGEVYYLSWIWLSPFDPEKVCYNSKTTGVMMQFMEEEDPGCFSGAAYP